MPIPTEKENARGLLQVLGPGILVAATGVGAGDLAGGALAGHNLGVGILWVVVVGALLKYVLCEGLARWQLHSGETLPDGAVEYFGRWFQRLFLLYLLVWSYCICGMLMSACGATAHAILPIGNSDTGRLVHGLLHSVAAVVLVRVGGFRWFERIMTLCIGIMFLTVTFAAIACVDDPPSILRGLLIPAIPWEKDNGIEWSLTLLAGVGGTVTMLCYGYWIREKGRIDPSALAACRIDLACGYFMTAVFGVAMVILGAALVQGEQIPKGVNLIMGLSTRISERIGGSAGTAAGWLFRAGAWGAVFSSLLGVWQSIPLLILDVRNGPGVPVSDQNSRFLRGSTALRLLWLIATVPAINLLHPLATVQLIAGIAGAAFLPMFALTLLLLGWRRVRGFRNGRLATALLCMCLVLFVVCLALELHSLTQ